MTCWLTALLTQEFVGVTLKWLTSFLQHQGQKVVLGERVSSHPLLMCGVPHGVILLTGMLFNIYMCPLTKLVWSFSLGCHQYLLMDGQMASASSNIAKRLEAMTGWLKPSWLRLKPSNREVLVGWRQPKVWVPPLSS